MIKTIIVVAILLLGFPGGYLLASLCYDELREGGKWFKIIIPLTIFLGIGTMFLQKDLGLSLFFLSIVTIVSLWKSYDKDFIK